MNDVLSPLISLGGWIGAAALLVAYFLVSRGTIAGDSLKYQALNIIGSVLLTINCASSGAWPSVIANAFYLLVGINILFTGYGLLKESTEGLMDVSLPEEDNERLRAILTSRAGAGVAFHQMRTRVSGARQFMDFHLLVPDDWSVKQGHDFLEDLSEEIVAEFPRMNVTGHIEPINDPRSYAHEGI